MYTSRSNVRRGAAGLLIAALCLLLPCQAVPESLLPEALRVPEAVNDKTTTVERGRFARTIGGAGTVVYPKTAHLYIEEGEGIFVAFHVRKGDIVRAGDVLATFTRDPQTVRHETLKLSKQRAEEALAEGIAEQEEAIADARTALMDLSAAPEREKALLALRRMELSLQRFVLEQEYAIANLQKQLDTLEADLADTALIAPFDGEIEFLVTKKAGDVVHTREILITMHAPEHVLLRVQDTNNGFRYGMEATIQGGNRNTPTILQGRVVAAANLLPFELRQPYAYVYTEDGETMAPLRNISAQVETIVLEDVLLVARNALTMQGGIYYARILAEDMVQKRFVTTSRHHLPELLILQGLSEGQTVLLD